MLSIYFIAHDVQKYTQVKLYVYFFILYSLYQISYCLHADQILPKFPAMHEKLRRAAVEE
jgi:hypothetical protein